MITQQEYFEDLRVLRNNYSSEEPEKIIHSDTDLVDGEPIKSKWRKSWITSVTMIIKVGLNRGYVNGKTEEESDKFQQYLDDTKIHNRLTCQEDISGGDSLLEVALGEE